MIHKFFSQKWLVANPSEYQLYKKVPLYTKAENGMIIYKPAGKQINAGRIKSNQVPSKLFVAWEDRALAYEELSERFYDQISEAIEANDPQSLQEIIVRLTDDSFTDPRYGSAIPAKGIARALVEHQMQNAYLPKLLLNLSGVDYTTTIHSIHTMALVMRFAQHKNFGAQETERITLAALLHDVGKSELPHQIIHSGRKLTDQEYEIMKSHSLKGSEILIANNMSNIAEAAAQHHERLDGSGYPYGLKEDEISYDGRLLAVVDSYESMTSDVRLYSTIKEPYVALKELRSQCSEGKYDFDVFSDFARSFTL